MKAVVAERGQVTIPKLLRQKLGIYPGTVIDFEIKHSSLVGVKMEQRDPIERVYGCIKGHRNTDDIINELRGKI